MDGGPFRAQQPADRRVISRPERRQPEEPQPVKAEPATAYKPAPVQRPVKKQKSLKRFIWPIVALIIVILGVAGWFVWSNMNSGTAAIDSSKYQAVFFSNGQIYFGKLQVVNNNYMKLTDIFYLQSQQPTDEKDATNPQKTSASQTNVQLIKLGDEIHGPEDEMIISKDQVSFYENLKPDGKVAQSIEKFKNK